ncbi:MAG: T9SS type A sorting domain-containing protein [Balneola sp.]
MKSKSLSTAVLISLFLMSAHFKTLNAQEIRVVEPLSMYKSVDSDNPLRFYNATDPGIPGGDINGDGIMEYIVQNPFYPDKSTLELGDYTDNTLIYNLDENANIGYYSIRTGMIFQPAGDLNGDGRDELITIKDSILTVYTFPEGPFDISGELTSIYQGALPYDPHQFVTDFDLDGDGHSDLVMGSHNFATGSAFHILFGGASGENFELQSLDTSTDLEGLEIQVNVGDLVGDEGPEVVLLTTTAWPYNVGTAVYEVSSERVVSFTGTSDLQTSVNSGASSLRFFVLNVDGEHKDDLLYSEDRYNRGTGFTQIFFNDPVPHFALSIDTSAAKVVSGGTMPDWANKTGESGLTFDRTLKSENEEVYLFFWSFGNLLTTAGQDISIENPIPDPVPFDILAKVYFYFQSRYSPQVNGNEARIGIGNPITWFGGIGAITGFSNPSLEINFGLNSISDHRSEISDTRAVEPNGTDILIGLGIISEWFPTQYLSLFGEVGLSLNLLEETNELTSIVGSEPTGSTTANGNVVVDIVGGAEFFGDEGFTVWFRKEAVNQPDSAEKLHSIKVSDFESLGEDTSISVKTQNIGDINNDGFDDLLMSSGFSYAMNSPINKAWLFYGGETYNSMPDYTFDFSQDSATANIFGTFVTTKMEPLGDINGDDIDDFAITAGGYSPTGGVYIYFGDEVFFDKETVQTEYRYPDLILTPSISESQTIFGFGQDISAGDFDGNGTMEIAVTIQTGYGDPRPATIYLFEMGEGADGIHDRVLTATKSSLGRSGDEVVSSMNGSVIQFLPKEEGKSYQDLLLSPGGFSGYSDAVIFEGGAEADSLPDITLRNPNRSNGFGALNGSKAGVGDLNEDGFYDIMMLSQADYEDAFVSSRVYFFSPNSGIEPVNNEDESINPFEYRLSQNYPNPFNPSTNIEFRLGNSSRVTLKVYDILGREVATLINGELYNKGSHQARFDASALASGIYLYRLEAGGFVQTRKMMLIK